MIRHHLFSCYGDQSINCQNEVFDKSSGRAATAVSNPPQNARFVLAFCLGNVSTTVWAAGLFRKHRERAEALFSLDRLAAFLRDDPLRLKRALNLAGCPIACQGISLDGFERRVRGNTGLQSTTAT